MHTHVKTLGILHIVFAGFGILLAIAAVLFFGGLAGIVGMSAPGDDAVIAIPVLGAIGGFIGLATLVLALPGLIAGIGLLSFRPWARILTIVLSLFELLHFPFGTALGVYGLWVLFAPETQPLFEVQRRVA